MFEVLDGKGYKMEISRIEDMVRGTEVETLRVRGSDRRCVYFKDEACCAPRVRFELCRTCYRINPRFAARNLFEKIKALAVKLFNLPETKPEQAHLE